VRNQWCGTVICHWHGRPQDQRPLELSASSVGNLLQRLAHPFGGGCSQLIQRRQRGSAEAHGDVSIGVATHDHPFAQYRTENGISVGLIGTRSDDADLRPHFARGDFIPDPRLPLLWGDMQFEVRDGGAESPPSLEEATSALPSLGATQAPPSASSERGCRICNCGESKTRRRSVQSERQQSHAHKRWNGIEIAIGEHTLTQVADDDHLSSGRGLT
jgi:hypothetical protein